MVRSINEKFSSHSARSVSGEPTQRQQALINKIAHRQKHRLKQSDGVVFKKLY